MCITRGDLLDRQKANPVGRRDEGQAEVSRGHSRLDDRAEGPNDNARRGARISMTEKRQKQTPKGLAETGVTGRNSGLNRIGAENVATRREEPSPETTRLIEAVVELPLLLQQIRMFRTRYQTAVYGTVRTVV